MDVLITSETEKLPPEIQQLQDDSRPIPPGVQFFEEKSGAGGLASSFVLGLLLLAAGVIVILFFFAILFTARSTTVYSDTLTYDFVLGGFGLALLIGGYLMLRSLRTRRRMMKAQQRGEQTRFGIFLFGDLLVSRNWFDTTIIPRAYFKGLKAGAVQYELNSELKSFNLPDVVGKDRSAVEAAIQSWAGSQSGRKD